MTRFMTTATLAVGLALSPLAAAQDTGMQDDQMPTSLDLNTLEENPGAYVGQRVSVRGEVQEVLGPRVFTLDEENWVDLDGETVVYLQSPRAVSLDDNDEVRVEGRVQLYTEARANLGNEWGWMNDAAWDADMSERPVIVAASVTSVEDDRRLDWGYDFGNDDYDNFEDEDPEYGYRYGENYGHQPIAAMDELTGAFETQHVGRRVELTNVTVTAVDPANGFWIRSGAAGEEIFVRGSDARTDREPAAGKPSPASVAADLKQDDQIAVHGTVLSMPENLDDRLDDQQGMYADMTDNRNDDIYIFATKITKSR